MKKRHNRSRGLLPHTVHWNTLFLRPELALSAFDQAGQFGVMDPQASVYAPVVYR